MTENNLTENNKNQIQACPVSERRCVIDGKSFIITRHFSGDKTLSSILTEIAVNRANKEMGL